VSYRVIDTAAGAATGTTSTRDVERDRWELRGKCREVDAELFFHPDQERGAARRRREAEAKAVCAACPVLAECREEALRKKIPHGVWGGLSEDEREEMATRRAKEAAEAAAAVEAGEESVSTGGLCGTWSGITWHRKLHEKLCDRCKTFSSAERAIGRQRRFDLLAPLAAAGMTMDEVMAQTGLTVKQVRQVIHAGGGADVLAQIEANTAARDAEAGEDAA
jgi:WhiB family redox-sensing transcriptional regulator